MITQMLPPPMDERAWLRSWWAFHEPEASLWVRFLRLLALWAPLRRNIIQNRKGTGPYLLRTYLTPKLGRMPRLYLHYFFAGDSADEAHNHPAGNSYALILSSGYIEGRFNPSTGRTDWASRMPGDVVHVHRSVFHRVMLRSRRPWSLFLMGRRVDLPKALSWGFMDPHTTAYVTHEVYKAQARGKTLPAWENASAADALRPNDRHGQRPVELEIVDWACSVCGNGETSDVTVCAKCREPRGTVRS